MSALYQRLDKDDIRLVTVESCKDDAVVIKLCTHPQSSAPDYDAVTYTWGHDHSMTTILCNGFELDIRRNLCNSLPFLNHSRPLPHRPLWIDAICLNQEDHVEKAVHVPLMGNVYENATRTLVWLGQSADDSDLALQGMDDLTQAMLAVDPEQIKYSLAHSQDIAKYGLPSVSDPIWGALQRLQLRDWFFRLWTLQEIVLSKNPLVMCGNNCISWEALPALQQAATKAYLDTLVTLPIDSDSPWEKSEFVIREIDAIRNRLRPIRNTMNLPIAIQFCTNRRYKEPVDRIWAILGLLGVHARRILQEAYLIDYSPAARLSYHETFLGIMKIQIEHNKPAAMQLLAEGLSQAKNPSLPSWCPDWHLKRTASPLCRVPGAAAGLPVNTVPTNSPAAFFHPVMSLDEDEDVCVHVQALSVDSIETLSTDIGAFWVDYIDRNNKIDVNRLGQSYNWLKDCLNIIHRLPEDAAHRIDISNTAPPLSEYAAWGAFVVQLHRQYSSALAEVGAILFPAHSLLDPGNSSFVLWCHRRKFFRTKAGGFGIGPADLKEDDIVCSLLGATPLIILRPAQHKTETNQNIKSSLLAQLEEKNEVIGDAYMPNFMHGEAFEESRSNSLRVFKLV
jgi:hypothetical protein